MREALAKGLWMTQSIDQWLQGMDLNKSESRI
jgi:hypothetical protein